LETLNKERVGDFILTYGGNKFYAIDPREGDIFVTDFAHALSRNHRFTGHSLRMYTVAEHCVHGVKLMQELDYSEFLQVAFLLHDASEAYIADIARPFKQYLPDYARLEEKIQNAIYTKYLGRVLTKGEHDMVKTIDNVMLINEMQQLMPPCDEWTYPEISEMYHVDLSKPLEHDYVKYLFLQLADDLGVVDK
jgi:hypothetical protein